MEITNIEVRFVMPRGWTEPLAVFMGKSAERKYITWHHIHWVRTSYQHTGQHGKCADSFARAKRATPEQYAPLLRELESIGYSVTIK